MSWLLLVETAMACPVCGGGGQNAQAFTNTCVFMSALPLMMIGGLVFYVYRLAQQQAALEEPVIGE